MKFIAIAAISLMASSAFAEETLAQMKAAANDHITQKISTLESSKGCIDGAKTKEAFKACKYDLHESMKAQKQEAMEEKLEDK